MSSPFESPAKRRLIMASNEQTQSKFQAIATIHNDSFIPTNQEQEEEDQTFGDINSNFIHFNGSQSQVIPPGYRFCPYDGELIFFYLKKKIDNEALPHDGIIDVNLYEHNPNYLTGSSLSVCAYSYLLVVLRHMIDALSCGFLVNDLFSSSTTPTCFAYFSSSPPPLPPPPQIRLRLHLCLLPPQTHRHPKNNNYPPNPPKSHNNYPPAPTGIDSGRYPPLGDKHWYFFTTRERKYPNGIRPNRTASDGYWKATGADMPVHHKGQEVGYKRALVFYLGKPREGIKTNWIMHEFIVDKPSRTKDGENDMTLDCVLCKIYKKEPGKGKEGADPTTLLASSVEENDLMFESSEHDDVCVQSTKLLQTSRSTDGFLPDHASIAVPDQPILNDETRPAEVRYPAFQHLDNKYFQEDDFSADLDTSLWGLEDNCRLYQPDDAFDDLDTILGGLEEDQGFVNPDGLFAQPPNLAGQNFDILV
ncbi:uncharacterized protein LOC131332988 [Rhododendron vialii]|uniref:uncharacterized protein LOC131332988 n=1 Tax=Rhododendron vialii TaxID=182163 RepID=UPI00265EF4EA|nr:uncharacterized protein LOC131332988 [Rhododendron vialii]